ncbi:hypothetical protein LCGC14_0466210 [marine sediment metagenome]|uniref:Uncharacterized protein n=1 Tax=marine sediment metagenome TaxID=412755 RepID=A0A0F9V0B3_9ZZZZ
MSGFEILEFVSKLEEKSAMKQSILERQAIAWASWFNNPIGNPPVSTDALVQEIRKEIAPISLDERARERGFASHKEFIALTEAVDLNNPELFQWFKTWKSSTGSRAMLGQILAKQRELEKEST